MINRRVSCGSPRKYSNRGLSFFPRQLFLRHGIVCNAEGDVYVVDTSNRRIQKFDSDGTFLLKWGTQRSGDGQFAEPWGITCDANFNIYVTDMGNNRVQKFR